jgi:hypothetical protein
MTTRSTDRQRQFFVLFLLALLPAGNALNPCLDVDTWWHLRIGEFIANEERLPDHDPFSQLGQQEVAPWRAYSWLYDLGLYEIYHAGGFAGILALRHALDLMTFGGIAWVLLRHARNAWLGLGTLALATVSLLPLMPERPWHFTIFFTTLTLHAVLRIREGCPLRRFAWLPAIYIVWANVHIQFVMGFALLGIGWLVTLIEWQIHSDETKNAAMKRLFILGAACALATLATPFHVRLYVVIWEYATQTQALALVSELAPPDLKWLHFYENKWWNLPLVFLLISAAAVVLYKGLRLWDVVLLASAFFFSLRMQRDLWYGVLIAGTIINSNLGKEKHERPFSAWQISLVSMLALLVMRFAWEIGLSQGKTFASCHAESYPVAAVEYLREHHRPGPLFNNFDWGGYLIWELRELPVSIDGRTNLYGDERLLRSMKTWGGVEGWDQDPDLLKAGVIVAPKKHKDKEYPLTGLLAADRRWKLVTEDESAAVFVPVALPP